MNLILCEHFKYFEFYPFGIAKRLEDSMKAEKRLRPKNKSIIIIIIKQKELNATTQSMKLLSS